MKITNYAPVVLLGSVLWGIGFVVSFHMYDLSIDKAHEIKKNLKENHDVVFKGSDYVDKIMKR